MAQQYSDLPPGATVVQPGPRYSDLPPGATIVHPLSVNPDAVPDMSKVAGATPGTPAPVGHAPALPYSPGLHSATALKNIGDVGIGALKDIPDAVSHIDNAVASVPYIGNALTTPLVGGGTSSQARQQMQKLATPQNTAQSVGKGIGQAVEFLVPGLGEEKAAALTAEHLPQLGEMAAPLARLGTQAVGAGLVNKLQGGDFAPGALMGAGAGAAGELTKLAAPAVAETAMGVRGTDRAFSAQPGRAILDETKGYFPRSVATSARNRTSDLAQEQGDIARGSEALVPLAPARQVVTDEMQAQADRNAIPQIERVRPVRNQLSFQGEPHGGFPSGVIPRRVPGEVIPDNVPVSEALDLRRGVGDFQAERPWTGRVSSDPLTNTLKRTYGALSGAVHDAEPKLIRIDERLHNLMPVADRANAKDLNAPLLQRIAGRVGAHTGALTGAAIGGMAGYREGGPAKALEYGLGGLLLPEAVADPAVQMRIARTLNSNAPAAMIRLGAGGAMSGLRRKAP